MAAATTTVNNNPPPPPSSSPSSLSLTRTESPRWTQIVRGQESESTRVPESPSLSPSSSTPVERDTCSSENNNENIDNVGGGKKAVWNKKPTNGPTENDGGLGLGGPVVMGPAEAWPALSESTSRTSPKLSSSPPPDVGSVSSPQVIGIESSSLSISSLLQSLAQSSSSQKPTTDDLNYNLPNHGQQACQKSMKRYGGDNTLANGGQSSSPAEGLHNYSHNSTKRTTGGGSEISGRDSSQNHGHRDSGPRNGSGDNRQLRHSYGRGNGGSHSWEGSHQNNGGRRNSQDWNHQKSFNGRNATTQPRVSPRGFRPPSVSAPFVHPAPMQPTFMNPMGVPEVPMFYLPGVPFVAPVPGPVFIHPALDPQLHVKIVNQIDYYFSNENLIKDTYLRQNMHEHGWVPVELIANFNKVMQLTENIQHILDAMRSSTVVEVQGDKIRKRNDWGRWIMTPSVQFATASGSQSPKSPTLDTLSVRIENVKVGENIDQNHSKGHFNVNAAATPSSGVLNSPTQAVTDGASSSGFICD